MELERERRVHTILSNLFYYSFVLIIVSLFILSLIIEEIALLNNILFISLIVSSLVIVFYLTVQMLRYNLTVNKKIQLGVFFVVIGFLLILVSTSKKVTLLENLGINYFGYDFFVYWGIGSVVLGIFVELTFLDQLLWKALIEPFKLLWKGIVKLAKWFAKNWYHIILYTLDLASIAGIVYVILSWGTIWWKPTILVISCVYPIIHHHKRIWRSIRYVAVEIIYQAMRSIYNFFKYVFTGIWKSLVKVAKFLKEYWWVILKELLRLAFAAGGGVMIYFGNSEENYSFLIGLGIAVIIFSMVFTRKIILSWTWRIIKRTSIFILDKIVVFAKFFVEHWWPILKELLRLTVAAGGAYMIYHGAVYTQFSYFIALGIIAIVVSLIFSRKAVLVGVWNVVSKVAIFIWENILKIYYIRVISEFIRLVFVGGGIFMIYFGGVNNVEFFYFIYIGLAVILLAEVFIRKWFLRKLYGALKEITLALWDFIKWLGRPFRYLWKLTVKLAKFLKENWFKVILYILDLVAIAAIIYLSITWQPSQWWYIVLLSISCCYIPIHHYKLVWRILKFIGIKVFYNPFLRFVFLIGDFFKALWNYIVDIAKFIKKYWWPFTKEVLRLLVFVGGVIMIGFGDRYENLRFLIWIGIAVLPISEIFSRKIVLVKIYNFFKAIVIFFYKHRVVLSRIIGFAAVITGIVLYFAFEDIIGLTVFITIVSVGGTFTLFAHFIYHPKRFWQFLISIPKTIYKVLVTIWLLMKSASIYIYRNGIRILLLLVMIFTFIYGIVVAVYDDYQMTFFGIFNDLDPAIRISLGAGFVVVAIVAFILLRREFKKLRTGMSKDVIKEIRRRWRDE